MQPSNGDSPRDPRRNELDLLYGGVDLQFGRFAEAERTLLDLRERMGNTPPYLMTTLCLNLGAGQWRLGKLDEADKTFRGGLTAGEALRQSNPASLLWLYPSSRETPGPSAIFAGSRY